MLSNLSNNNAGNQTKSVVEKKHYEEIESRLDEMQNEIDTNTESINQNAQDISGLDERIGVVENNSTFPELNTDTINPATGSKIEITSDLDVDGAITAETANFDTLSVSGTNFTIVKDNAAQAKSIAENAEDKADEAYDLADAVADELADYKGDNEVSITTGTLNADSADIDSIASQTINTNDFETTNAEIDDLYVDRIHATGELALPTIGQSYYTITIPAGTIASFAGSYITENEEIEYFYFTVTDGDVIYHQAALDVIKDISFDRETGNTKVRVKSTGAITYISSSMNVADPTIEDGGSAYSDFSFIPQKLGGQIIRGYNDTTTETFIAGVLNAYAITADEIHYERTVVDDLIVNAAIELPKEWNQSGNISRSSGTKGQYISIQTKDGVDKPTWTDPVNNPIGSLSYSDKLIDEATMAAYKGISETRQTRTINVVDEASLNQLSAYLWTKNNDYWQPYEKTRITIGDHTLWIDPTESNQGIRFYDGMVIADGTWDDSPVEEANTPPVNIVIYDAPTELSYPITNLGDKTTVHGEITATCFKGNVLGNVTGNADTATNATCFNNKTYAEAKEDILSGTANNATCFDGCTYADAKADILAGTANNASCFDGCTYECAKADILNGTANNATCFDGCTYAEAKADILSGCAAEANNATCFNGCTYNCAKADILSGCASEANNATCFAGCTYSQAKEDILSGNAASATNATCFNGCTYACAKYDIRNYTPTCAYCASKVDVSFNTETSPAQHPLLIAGTYPQGQATSVQSADCLYVVPSQKRLYTHNLCSLGCAELGDACALNLRVYNEIDGKIQNSTCFAGRSYTAVKEDILAGTANNATCFNGCTYACAKADILTGTAANSTCFNGRTYSQAKADILTGTAKNATCFNGKTYACAKADILSGTAAQAHCVDIDSLTTSSYPLVMESATCELGKSGTCSITFAPSTGILETTQVSTACIENSGTIQSCNFCATNDVNIDGNTYITGDLTVLGTTTTTHSEEVVTPSENILLRDTATTPISSGCYSGFIVKNYDGSNNDLEVGANSDGTLHVGVVGGTMEPVATRATEACMENDYVAHWDSTGIDLATKGASCTHDLCVNGNATITGTLTANLTGNASSATNATCFNGCTYSQAKTDILSGNAASATNATCFNGCTYSQAKSDILTGTAKNATCFNGCTYSCAKADILSGCAADSAKLGNKAASCYIDNSSTAQTKAGNLSIGNPAACTSTSAGGTGNILDSTGIDIYGSTSLPHIHFHNNKYCGKYSARIANTTGRVALTVNNGTGCTEATESKIFDFCSNGTFSGATNICGTNIYQNGNKVIDSSSNNQTKAGSLCVGNPTGCTETSAGGNGIFISCCGCLELYTCQPSLNFHYNKNCGSYSSRLIANAKGRLVAVVTDAEGCCAETTRATYCFCSDGTFSGASTICASCNIYSAGCPVVTTGNIATVAPGYNCTGTSNYVVTTKVCCAEKADCITRTGQPMTWVDANTSTISSIYGVTFSCYNCSCTAQAECSCGYPSNYGLVLTVNRHDATKPWGYQIAKATGGGRFYYRDWTNSTSVSNTWCQLIDSTGGQTINGNLTIPTACGSFCGNLCGSACTVRRIATHNNATCQLALLGGCTSTDGAGVYVSDCCPISYNPSTGVLCACILRNNLGVVNVTKTEITAGNLGLTVGCVYDFQCVITQLTCCFGGQPAIYSGCFQNSSSFYVCWDGRDCYYSYEYVFEKLDRANPVVYSWQNAHWRVSNKAGCEWIIQDQSRSTAGERVLTVCKVGDIAKSVCNVPASASTTCNVTITAGCCSATAPTNFCMCMCGSDGKLYNPQGFMVGSCPVALLCDVPTLPPQPTQEDHYTVACYECGTTNVVTLSWDSSVCKTSEIFNLIMTCGKVCCMMDCITEWNRVCTIKYCEYPHISIVGAMTIPSGSCAASCECSGTIMPVGVYSMYRNCASQFTVRYSGRNTDYFYMSSYDRTNECCGTVWMLGGGTVTITTPKITV